MSSVREKRYRILILCIVVAIGGFPAHAQTIVDSDGDGIADHDERTIYGTDPVNPDTDGDGFSDGTEIASGFSPLRGNGVKIADSDTDGDGLNDAFELAFGTRIVNRDSDEDGYGDYQEISHGYDPRTKHPVRVEKKIVITLSTQRLGAYVNDIRLSESAISSGRWNWPTPTGEFIIANKSPRAWSRMAGLWMPYWMGLGGKGIRTGAFGIHELPEWPNGYKEGENHLGTPVSHGCIRLGVGAAQKLYEWAPVGTKVTIKK